MQAIDFAELLSDVVVMLVCIEQGLLQALQTSVVRVVVQSVPQCESLLRIVRQRNVLLNCQSGQLVRRCLASVGVDDGERWH